MLPLPNCQHLADLVETALESDQAESQLRDHVWDVIELFTNTPREDHPPLGRTEEVFWFVIWQLQHLLDDDFAPGAREAQLRELVSYLRGERPLPHGCRGRRPI